MVKEKGGVCLDEYTGANERYRFICANGHEFTGIATYITCGRWCRQCADEEKRLRYQEKLRQFALARGGKLVSEYTGIRNKVEWECDRGHHWRSHPASNLSRGHWCRECASMSRLSNASSIAKLRYRTAPLHSGELSLR
jgi:hypothetical protein